MNDWRATKPPGVAPAQCVGDAGAHSCYDGNDTFRCLSFEVDDASQPIIANDFSLCVDKAICLAAAAGYPGGAFCAGP